MIERPGLKDRLHHLLLQSEHSSAEGSYLIRKDEISSLCRQRSVPFIDGLT